MSVWEINFDDDILAGVVFGRVNAAQRFARWLFQAVVIPECFDPKGLKSMMCLSSVSVFACEWVNSCVHVVHLDSGRMQMLGCVYISLVGIKTHWICDTESHIHGVRAYCDRSRTSGHVIFALVGFSTIRHRYASTLK